MSVPAPPSSKVSFCAPTMTSLPDPAVMLSGLPEPAIVKPSVWFDRFNVTPDVSVTFSILTIWPSLLLVKFAPI